MNSAKYYNQYQPGFPIDPSVLSAHYLNYKPNVKQVSIGHSQSTGSVKPEKKMTPFEIKVATMRREKAEMARQKKLKLERKALERELEEHERQKRESMSFVEIEQLKHEEFLKKRAEELEEEKLQLALARQKAIEERKKSEQEKLQKELEEHEKEKEKEKKLKEAECLRDDQKRLARELQSMTVRSRKRKKKK